MADDENDIIYVREYLHQAVGVSVWEGQGSMMKKVINGGPKVCTKDRSGQALALKYTLRDF